MLRDLPPLLLDYVAGNVRECRLDEGQALFFKNDPGDFLALVASGRIYKVLYGPDGQELILGTVGPGEVVDEAVLLDRHERSFTAIAYAETVVLKLARRHFLQLVSEPMVMRRASAALCTRLRQAFENLEDLGLHGLESRLARHLLRQPLGRVRHEHVVEIALPPTQSILAAMVNASRPRLNAQLQLWHRSGLASHRHHMLRINDIDEFRCKAHLRPI